MIGASSIFKLTRIASDYPSSLPPVSKIRGAFFEAVLFCTRKQEERIGFEGSNRYSLQINEYDLSMS